MSMPAGFGNASAYNLPTSFSGTFQQPFPGQAPFSQPPVYPQQPNGVCVSSYTTHRKRTLKGWNGGDADDSTFCQSVQLQVTFKCQRPCASGGGYPAYSQAKPVGAPYGQAMAGPMISSNPFLVSDF